MKAREFDPVLSAALRNELEALPTPSAPRSLPVPRRPQAWVTLVTALVLLAATVGVLHLTVGGAQPARTSGSIVDPLQRVTDPEDPQYIEDGVDPLLHIGGTGPGTYAIEVPAGVTSVRPLIACSPAADFRITVVLATWTRCDREGTPGFGDIPLSSGPHQLAVQVPAGVRWRLVVIATPGTGDPVTRAPSSSAASLQRVARYPAPEREGDVPVGVAHGTGAASGRLTAAVDELAVATACTGTGGFVISMSNGLQLGTDDAPLPCGTDRRSVQAVNDDTARGYRDDGRLTWRVRTIGAASWSATFSTRTEERLPYPPVTGTLLARSRGSSIESQGALAHDASRVRVVVTCRGTGSLSVSLDRSDAPRASHGSPAIACGSTVVRTVQDLAAPAGRAALRYDVRPTGRVLWTVQVVRD